MKGYGLQLRVQPSQKKQSTKPPIPRPPSIFANDDDDDDNVDSEIARQAIKKKDHKDVEQIHKKALEEDPLIFDYDGAYEQIKQEQIRPLIQDKEKRESKYIQRLMQKAKEREKDQEIVYERKLAKERSQDDHLYADKDKFVTNAYKRKLAEQEKWMEEERKRELREQKEDVTKKKDISDFYFNLTKNVAFGAQATESRLPVREEKPTAPTSKKEVPLVIKDPANLSREEAGDHVEASKKPDNDIGSSDVNPNKIGSSDVKPLPDTSSKGPDAADQPVTEQQPKSDFHKKTEDALSAAKERFLARKKSKLQ